MILAKSCAVSYLKICVWGKVSMYMLAFRRKACDLWEPLGEIPLLRTLVGLCWDPYQIRRPRACGFPDEGTKSNIEYLAALDNGVGVRWINFGGRTFFDKVNLGWALSVDSGVARYVSKV